MQIVEPLSAPVQADLVAAGGITDNFAASAAPRPPSELQRTAATTMPNEKLQAAERGPSPWSHRVPMAVALTLAACVFWPTLLSWQRVRVAQRLAERAGTSTAGEARATIRELSQLGVDASCPLVQLAGSQRDEVATAAQGALLDQLTRWQIEYESGGDLGKLREQLTAVACAIDQHAAQFGNAGRRWAQRVARQLFNASKPLAAEDDWHIVAVCERVLALPVAHQSQPPLESTEGDRAAPAIAGPAPVASVATIASQEHSAENSAAEQPLGVGPPAELAVVMHPPSERTLSTPPLQASGPGNVLRSPVTPLEPEPHDSGTPVRHNDENPSPTASTPVAGDDVVVDIPSPQDQRLDRRRLRGLADRDLIRLLDGGSRYEASIARTVLEQRGYSAGILRVLQEFDSLPTNQRRATVERAASLPAAEARRLLRRLVTDEDPEIRLLALTTLATAGDPHLDVIARQRAVEDADPRVADLAAKLMQQVK